MTECLVVLATLRPALRRRPAAPTMPPAQVRVTLRPQEGMPMHLTRRED